METPPAVAPRRKRTTATRTTSSRPKAVGHDDPRLLAQALIARLVADASGQADSDGAPEGMRVLLDVAVDRVRCLVTAQVETTPEPPALSPREAEIARMVSLGYPNKTIAAVLEISVWTVGTHLRRIFAKLGVQSRPRWWRCCCVVALPPSTPRPTRHLAMALVARAAVQQCHVLTLADGVRRSRPGRTLASPDPPPALRPEAARWPCASAGRRSRIGRVISVTGRRA